MIIKTLKSVVRFKVNKTLIEDIGTRISSLETKELINSNLTLKFSSFSMACNYSKAYQSSYILRRPLQFDIISKLNFELLTSIKKSLGILSYLCCLLEIYELYQFCFWSLTVIQALSKQEVSNNFVLNTMNCSCSLKRPE
jgi:hypothetical protein